MKETDDPLATFDDYFLDRGAAEAYEYIGRAVNKAKEAGDVTELLRLARHAAFHLAGNFSDCWDYTLEYHQLILEYDPADVLSLAAVSRYYESNGHADKALKQPSQPRTAYEQATGISELTRELRLRAIDRRVRRLQRPE